METKDYVDEAIDENQDLLPENERPNYTPSEPDVDRQHDLYVEKWHEALCDKLEETINEITALKGYYHNRKDKAIEDSIGHLTFIKTLTKKDVKA